MMIANALVGGEGQEAVSPDLWEHFECSHSVPAVWMVCRCVEQQTSGKSKHNQ